MPAPGRASTSRAADARASRIPVHFPRTRIVCTNLERDFNGDRPLPILGVDEPIYRRLPAFLIATVDKFATLPWIGSSSALLGGADRAAPRTPLTRT